MEREQETERHKTEAQKERESPQKDRGSPVVLLPIIRALVTL